MTLTSTVGASPARAASRVVDESVRMSMLAVHTDDGSQLTAVRALVPRCVVHGEDRTAINAPAWRVRCSSVP